MRLEPSDPDIETVVTRIERGDINLQPDFQRGEVWSRSKQQRLVDSILRDWHVPPIHVIELKGSHKQEVLDGQQRLAAIRDFVRGEFAVNGRLDPQDYEIYKLDGLKYRDLPEDWRRRFNQFTLRIFRIVDYKSDEPAELFFRLNQPTSLTAAEQRNAFFGPVRTQIKELVEMLNEKGLDKSFFGFSNSRMAYDDILARVAFTVEKNNVAARVTSNDLVDIYRSESPLSDGTIHWVRRAIEFFVAVRPELTGRVHFNKATLYSWFLFVIRGLNYLGANNFSSQEISAFIEAFQSNVAFRGVLLDLPSERSEEDRLRVHLLSVFESRSSSRVADASSVILRDAVIWLEFEEYVRQRRLSIDLSGLGIVDIRKLAYQTGSPFDEDQFARSIVDLGWGRLL